MPSKRGPKTRATPENIRIFAESYCITHSSNRAYRRIGFAGTEGSCGVLGAKFLRRPEVQAEIARIKKESCERLQVTHENILRRLAQMTFFDPRKMFNEDGSLKPITELDEDTAAAISAFDIEELYAHFGGGGAKPKGQVKKIKFSDSGLNAERLGRTLKMFTDKVEVSGLDQLADELAKARARVKPEGDNS